MRPAADRIASWLVRHRAVLAVVAVALAAVSVQQSRRLEFARSIETMFDRTDPALVPYRRMARAFGASEAVLAAYVDPRLFSPEGIARLRSLADDLAKLPNVASTTCLADTPLGDRIIDVEHNAAARRIVGLMEGYAVGADHETAAVVCLLAPPPAGRPTAREQAVSRADTIDRIRDAVAGFVAREGLATGTVAGEPVMLRDGFAMLERDGNVLGTASAALSGLVLLVSVRSLYSQGTRGVALMRTHGVLAVSP
jgi:predicted RND superfamily exporter protein